MLLKIIILLGFIFLADYAATGDVGNCGSCQKNHVACHSEDTYSLCVEGKPTDSVISCPENNICTDDPAICIGKDNSALTPSCITGKFSKETGSCYERQDVLKPNSSSMTLDSKARDLSDEGNENKTDNPSTTESKSSKTTVEPAMTEVSDCNCSKTTDKPSTPDSGKVEISSSTEDSYTRTPTDSATTNESVSFITEGLSTIETTESPFLSSSSTQDISSSGGSTIDIEASTRAPRDATTFCSENKDIGTFRAEGDTTCKRYYICTTYKDGFKGYEFNCGEIYYFNPETSLCQKEKLDEC